MNGTQSGPLIPPAPGSGDELSKASASVLAEIEAEQKRTALKTPKPPEAPAPANTASAPAPAPEAPAEPGPDAPPAVPGTPPPAGDTVNMDFTEEHLEQIYDSCFRSIGMMASGMEFWELQEWEKKSLAKSTKAILDKYGLRVSPVTAFFLSVTPILGPRAFLTYQVYMANKAKKVSPVPPPAKQETPPAPKGKDKAPDKPAEPAKVKEEPPEPSGWSGDDKDNGHTIKH